MILIMKCAKKKLALVWGLESKAKEGRTKNGTPIFKNKMKHLQKEKDYDIMKEKDLELNMEENKKLALLRVLQILEQYSDMNPY